MAGPRLREGIIDLQTILIVGLLYWLLREEQSNAFLRTWLSDNFPLGLYLLAPLTVAAISGTLLVLTAVRIVLFVAKGDLVLRSWGVLRGLNLQRKRLRVFISNKGRNSSVVVLISLGLALSVYSYVVVGVASLAALGISCIILGFTVVSLPRRIGGPGIRAMLQGATLSFEAQLEQSTVRRATYLPPGDGGIISAYIPLNPETETLSLNEMRQASKSLTSKNQKGVLVYPVGSELTKIPDLENGLSIEERLRYILVESANLCSRVTAEETGSRIIVGMKGADLNIQGQKYLESLGSLPSSLAACVIAMSHNKPVTLIEEKKDGDRMVAVFQLLG
jgi:hypothetical protein